MKKPFMRIACLSLASVLGLAVAQAQPVTISAMTSFGGGDGNLTVAEANANAAANSLAANTIVDAGNLTRGMAYNRATGNLIVVNRQGGINLNVLSGTTGNYIRRLSNTGITGGGFAASMTGVTSDGQVFVSNLLNADNEHFSLYRFASDSETGASTRVFHGPGGGWSASRRLGDSLDVMGSGNSVSLVAGSGARSGTNGRGYMHFSQDGTGAFVANEVNLGTTIVNDFRLGITFSHDGTRVFGTQGGSSMRVTDAVSGTLLGTATLTSSSERLLDSAFINGFHMLATADTASSLVRIYNIDNALSPVLRASLDITTSDTVNTNATGSIQWGSINGKDATLYVMNTNNGIQAYNVEVVPEPATLLALGAGVAALVARRRRKA